MLILALISTVALLVCMGFFMMGSLPLLILKHDTPLDSGFIRGLFNWYYVAIIVTAPIGTLGYAFTEHAMIALAFGCVAVLGLAGRYWMVARMDMLRSMMTAHDAWAIKRFRQLHIAGMLLNALLLAAVCICLAQLPF